MAVRGGGAIAFQAGVVYEDDFARLGRGRFAMPEIREIPRSVGQPDHGRPGHLWLIEAATGRDVPDRNRVGDVHQLAAPIPRTGARNRPPCCETGSLHRVLDPSYWALAELGLTERDLFGVRSLDWRALRLAGSPMSLPPGREQADRSQKGTKA